MIKRNEFCPECEEVRPVEVISREEKLKVRGEEFNVESVVHRCTECDSEYTTSLDSSDPVAAAFDLYREKHSMLFPAQIQAFRRKYELTQKELSSLLGWGAVTLSRYENGALQDLAHDRELQSAMTAEGLRKLVQLSPSALSESKRERLLQILDSRRGTRTGMLGQLEERYASQGPSENNGFRRFSIGRFCAALEFLVSAGGVCKTKLNKLLFFADFHHFRKYQVSITGCCYARLPYGPVPDNYKTLLAVMEDEAGLVTTEVVDYDGAEFQGEKILPAASLNDYTLSADELETLRLVRDVFKDYGAGKIAELSHEFIGWIETEHARLISYEFAESLELPN